MSAIAKHAVETGHIHWQPRVPRREKKNTERKVREALIINTLAKKSKDNLINQDGGMDLSNLWLG